MTGSASHSRGTPLVNLKAPSGGVSRFTPSGGTSQAKAFDFGPFSGILGGIGSIANAFTSGDVADANAAAAEAQAEAAIIMQQNASMDAAAARQQQLTIVKWLIGGSIGALLLFLILR